MDLKEIKAVPHWRRNPATVNPPQDIDDFKWRSNRYFEECEECDMRPTITGYAVAVGLPGPTSLLRLGQRIPELRYVISRCMITIASHYEDMMGSGNAAGPIFMLKNIPDFDPDEPIGSPAVQFFNDRKEVLLTSNVIGAARSDKGHEDEDPLEAYIRVIRANGYIEEDEEEAKTSLVVNKPKASYPPRPIRRSLTIISEGWEDDV